MWSCETDWTDETDETGVKDKTGENGFEFGLEFGWLQNGPSLIKVEMTNEYGSKKLTFLVPELLCGWT